MAKFEDNKDGSCTVKLESPIMVGGEEISRLTIPAIKGRHLMTAPFAYSDIPSMGDWSTFAARIVTPAGAFEELEVADAIAVGLRAMSMTTGKYRATGEKSSE